MPLSLLLITDFEALRRKYGPHGADYVKAAVDELLGTVTRSVEIADVSFGECPERYLEGSRFTEEVGRLDPQHVLIVGGPDVVPFCRVKKFVEGGDPDRPIESDAWDLAWGCGMWPAREPAVGRLPGDATDNYLFLVKQVRRAAEAHRQPKVTDNSACITANLWAEAAERTFEHWRRISGRDGEVLKSPPLGSHLNAHITARLDGGWMSPGRLLFVSLHGHPVLNWWWGDDETFVEKPGEAATYLRAIDPALVAEWDSRDAAVFSGGCWAAGITGKKVSESVSLSFLDQGALFFVGCTYITWEYLNPPGGIDNLIREVWRQSTGGTMGQAIVHARDVYRHGSRVYQDLDEIMCYSLVLYGDPTLSMAAA